VCRGGRKSADIASSKAQENLGGSVISQVGITTLREGD